MMKKVLLKNTIKSSALAFFIGLASSAYGVNLNYEGISFLEKPIATHIGDITLELNGLVDGAAQINSESDNDGVFSSAIQISAETQLRNNLTIGAAYFAEYVSNADDEYNDNLAAFMRGIWGTLSLGDVTGLVEKETSRDVSVGNASLAFDGQFGELNDAGLTFIGRIGPSRYGFTIDEDSNYAAAWMFQRPIGNRDYRFALRYQDTEFTAIDGATTFDSQGVNFIAELTYGSTIFDFGLGFEKLTADNIDVDRRYASVGVTRKMGVLSLSAEAHIGDVDGQDEISYALGARYDISRGLSLNLGINHADSEVEIDGVTLQEEDDTSAILSVTYRF